MNTVSNYRTIPHTTLVFTGSIADINKFEGEVTLFLELNSDNDRALVLMLNTTGGITEHVLALCGLLELVKKQGHKVYVHVLGQLCHFTYHIGAVADFLIMEPNASLVFGQPQVKTSGNFAQMETEIARMRGQFHDLVNVMVKKSKGKLNFDDVAAWKTVHITAQRALEMGLCDEVAEQPKPLEKGTRNEHLVRILGSMGDEATIFALMIKLNLWLHDEKNDGRPLRVVLTSHGGTVTLALTVYGLLLEAQRQGHYLTLEVTGQAYSSALWFTTCALGTGTVELDCRAKFMFHSPYRESLSGRLDEMDDLVAVEKGVYCQTRALLERAPGFNQDYFAKRENMPDHYFNADEAAAMGMGTLVGA